MTPANVGVMTPRKIDGMVNAPGTPRRTVRIDDALWNSAQEMAEKNGDSVSEIVRVGLERYVGADYLDKRGTRQIILDTIEEMAQELQGVRSGYSDPDHMAMYVDHPLWELGAPGLIIIEAWLRLNIDERRAEWGLPEDPENVMAIDEEDLP